MSRKLGSLFFLLSLSAQAQTPLCLSIGGGLDKMCARKIAQDATCPKGQIAWERSSCLNFDNEVIREIVALEDGATIPTSAYRVYSTEFIARSIAYRFFQRTIRPAMTETDILRPGYDMYNDVFPMVAFHAKVLPFIVAKGFLNQHQTGTGSGTLDRNARASAEDRLLNLKIEPTYNIGLPAMRTPNFLRPKYGFAVFAKKHSSINPDYRGHYGDIYAVFNDDVKKRAFLTNQDSLDHYQVYPNVQLRINSYYSNFSNFYYPQLHGYYETQIWGALKFSDVKYFLVDCFAGQNAAASIGESLKALNVDIPVFKCLLTKDGKFIFPKPGRQIYGPTGIALQQLRAVVNSTIRVQSATFGGNIKGIDDGNATQAAANYCNTKTTCTYKVSLKFLEDPAPKQEKSFSIRWVCTGDSPDQARELEIPADSVNQSLTLSCEK